MYFLTPFQFKCYDVLQVGRHFRIKTQMNTKTTSVNIDFYSTDIETGVSN